MHHLYDLASLLPVLVIGAAMLFSILVAADWAERLTLHGL